MSPDAGPGGPSITHLRLLTHRMTSMVAWWSALLGEQARTLNTRTTAITTPTLRVVIERSEIALDFHPEASGVTAIGFAPDGDRPGQDTLDRLAALGSFPLRATRHSGVTRLWFRDPNGMNVTLELPSSDVGDDTALFPEELDLDAVLTTLRASDKT